MFTIFTLILEEAKRMVQYIKDAAAKDGGGPVAIVVLGRDRAKVLISEMMEGLSSESQDIASQMAMAALMEGHDKGSGFVVKVNRPDGQGEVVAAIGISGRRSLAQDKELVKVALEEFSYLCGE